MKLIYSLFIIFSVLSCKNSERIEIEKLHIDNIIQVKGETISQNPGRKLYCRNNKRYIPVFTK